MTVPENATGVYRTICCHNAKTAWTVDVLVGWYRTEIHDTPKDIPFTAENFDKELLEKELEKIH